MEEGQDELKFDASELKILASDTRVEILKKLKERNYTVSELAKKTGHSKSTLHEHVSRLVDASLVEKADNYTDKWIYYKLTRRGKGLFVDNTKRVVIVLSLLLLIVGGMQLIYFFNALPLLDPNANLFTATMSQAQIPGFSSESLAKSAAIEPPLPESESVLGARDGGAEMDETESNAIAVSEDQIEGERIALETETKQKLYDRLSAGIGLIMAAFILLVYWHSKPLKLNVAKKK